MRYCNLRRHAFFISVDGNFSHWSFWSLCSVTCGGGIRRRKRMCDHPSPKYGGKDCPGKRLDVQDCNASKTCPGVYKIFEIFVIIQKMLTFLKHIFFRWRFVQTLDFLVKLFTWLRGNYDEETWLWWKLFNFSKSDQRMQHWTVCWYV